MSAITLLGVSFENYTFGTQFVVINLAYIIGTPIVAYVYLPVFFRLQTASAYEYLERRFGKASRLYASLLFTLQVNDALDSYFIEYNAVIIFRWCCTCLLWYTPQL